MKLFALGFVSALALLSVVVILCDALPRMHAALRRRRKRQGGAFGVVVDRTGAVVGAYLDPFGHPWRAARIHDHQSPWVKPGPDGQGWAWEGFGATELEAAGAANRLRRRHLLLLPELRDRGDGGGLIPLPYAPPAGE